MQKPDLPDFTLTPPTPRPVQYFTPEYLARCQQMSNEEVVAFLEAFAQLQLAQRVED